MMDINSFDAIQIGLASPRQIRDWSHGEVTKPETINYRTLKPEKEGLFCEKIFGPTRDWECYCGKYKRVRYKGIVCERCGVEVTRAKVRRDRMGHIELAAPVSHIWFFKGVPSRIGYLLDIAPKELEKVLYFAASIITSVDVDKRASDLGDLKKRVNEELDRVSSDRDEILAMIDAREKRRRAFLNEGSNKGFDEDDTLWRESLEGAAEESALPKLKDVRKLADGLFADMTGQLQGGEDRKALLTIVKNAKFQPDRRLTREETQTLSEWCQYIIKSFKDANDAMIKRRVKYLRSPKGAMSGFAEDDRVWYEAASKHTVNEWDLDKLRTFAAHLAADVVENAPGFKPKQVKDTIQEYALRTGGAISKEENDMLVQWGMKVRDSFQELETRRTDIREGADDEADRLTRAWELFQELEPRKIVADEPLFRELHDRFATPEPYGFGQYFKGGMGAEAIRDLLSQVDAEAETERLREEIRTAKGQKQQKAIKRLKVVNAFVTSENQAEWMILDVIPVIPPELRPMVQLDGGRFATSDLNDLYRRVINRNNRLKRLLDLGAPEIIVNNEKRMLQEAVDALFDNGRRGRAVTGPGNRALKSLSDMLKGKQGRFRGNLLGKRVDYSGRSVIVSGPSLRLHQCGLPKLMALELFKPFIMARLVERKSVQNIKAAKKMVESMVPEVWDVLEEVISEHPVLLNRAPTLHRLGIQAFEPVLVEGKAIQVHPLVCAAYNADFDGDQMAVHLPLSAEAQAEARLLMLSTHNILSPASGEPLATPSQDMVLGLYYLTYHRDDLSTLTFKDMDKKNPHPIFGSAEQVMYAYDAGQIELQQQIAVRLNRYRDDEVEVFEAITTPGRVMFNDAIERNLATTLDVFDSADHEWVNETLTKKRATRYIVDMVDEFGPETVAQVLDTVKDLGFKYATQSGITISKDDIIVPQEKHEVIAGYDKKVGVISEQYERGLITEQERKEAVIDLWTKATDDVADVMVTKLDDSNPVYSMVDSGARGSFKNISQLAGMRGLMSNPKGEIIDQPIRSNFMEGLSVLEFFISTHGARKGLADTALRTADSGYLTRRLVDVAQDVIIREEDCKPTEFIDLDIADENGALNRHAMSRMLVEPAKVGRTTFLEAGELFNEAAAEAMLAAAGDTIPTVKLRSVLYCNAARGVCRTCYGLSLATGKPAELGDVVGTIAAQSIGEPGTQLTMRTFHTGGVAGADITHGLPRVVEIFEARNPKGAAELFDPGADAEFYADGGVVALETLDTGTSITVTPTKKPAADADFEPWSVIVQRGRRILVENGDEVVPGHALTEGSVNPHDLLRLQNSFATARYLVNEVQKVYLSQGVEIHDKHIETIVRQMLKKVRILTAGESPWLPGEMVDRLKVEAFHKSLGRRKTGHAEVEQIILGITKASLATDSFFSAASFQETTKVITDAALEGKTDDLVGLKENVIIGKLIPAATGLGRYQKIKFGPAERPKTFYEAEEFLGGLDFGDDIELALGKDE